MSEITLEQLYEMQKVLDARIIKEKGLEGQDLLPNTLLALQVELGELANEWRGFKHWSNDQKPRLEVKCHLCNGRGTLHHFPFDDGGSEPCAYCEGTGVKAKPLLEEYVDCLHFVLSIARQINCEVIHVEEFNGNEEINKGFLHCFNVVNSLWIGYEWGMELKSYFIKLISVFLTLGKLLGFTFEQIAAAYLEKNKTNHERQANGY